MRLASLAAVLCVAATPLIAQDISGEYQVAGTNLDGTGYTGTASVTMLSDSTCDVQWLTGADSLSSGVCMVANGMVAVSYTMGDVMGLAVYTVAPDGTLSGEWTIDGQDGTGTETLIPQG
jgi:hypothetical protein